MRQHAHASDSTPTRLVSTARLPAGLRSPSQTSHHGTCRSQTSIRRGLHRLESDKWLRFGLELDGMLGSHPLCSIARLAPSASNRQLCVIPSPP